MADSLIRLKHSGDNITILLDTNYSFLTSGRQRIFLDRTFSGQSFSEQLFNHRIFDVPIINIPIADVNTLRTWFTEREHLLFTENHSATNVDSGLNVKITEFKLESFARPYVLNEYTGSIKIEEF